MASLAEVWSRLRRVRSVRFDARSGADTGWDGVGIGTVAVSQPAAGVLVFEEVGTWQPSAPDRPSVQFSNVFRWSVVGKTLRLEHLRFGPGNPVLLFDMASGAAGEWREVNPHLCREDCYTASMLIDDRQLVMG